MERNKLRGGERRRPRLNLKPRSRRLSWVDLHLGNRLNHGTYGIISAYKDTLTNPQRTEVLNIQINPRKAIKEPIQELDVENGCPIDFVHELEKHILVRNLIIFCKTLSSNFCFDIPDTYSDVISDVRTRKCYYVMERLYPANADWKGVHTDKIGQIFFQIEDERVNTSLIYDGYEYGIDGIRDIGFHMDIQLDDIVRDMAIFCSMCYLNNILPEDVEYVLAKRYDGQPQLFIIDFDKVQVFETTISPEAAYQRLIAHLSYPSGG